MAARLTFRIPGRWPGILFFAAVLAFPPAGPGGTPGRLAAELAAEGASEEGWLEARRAAHGEKTGEGTGAGEDELLAAPRLAWASGRHEKALAEWRRLAEDEGTARAVRERALLESGEALASLDDLAGALRLLRCVFLETEDPGLFRAATADLDAVFKRDSKLKKGEEALAEQMALCRGMLTSRERRQARERTDPPPRPGLLSRAVRWPGNAVVGFYRAQISPAIGSRCAMTPSCSEYFLQATRLHGLLGIPLGADRLVREPDVLKRGGPWVLLQNGDYRLSDPVADHDYWLHSKGKAP